MNPFVFVWRFFFSSSVFAPLSRRCCSTTSCDHRTRTQHKIQLQNHSTASSTSANTMELFAWDYDSTVQLNALVVVDEADDNDVMIQNEKREKKQHKIDGWLLSCQVTAKWAKIKAKHDYFPWQSIAGSLFCNTLWSLSHSSQPGTYLQAVGRLAHRITFECTRCTRATQHDTADEWPI